MKRDSNGLSLLKRGQKGLIHAIFSRMGLILILLLIQVFVLFSVFQWFAGLLPYTLGGTALFITLMVLYLLNSSIDPTAKITWLVIIMLAVLVHPERNRPPGGEGPPEPPDSADPKQHSPIPGGSGGSGGGEPRGRRPGPLHPAQRVLPGL